MQKIHCNGCGKSEESNIENPTIGRVDITDLIDTRTWTINPKFETDLCRSCLYELLLDYFGVSTDDEIYFPNDWIEPQSSEVVERVKKYL